MGGLTSVCWHHRRGAELHGLCKVAQRPHSGAGWHHEPRVVSSAPGPLRGHPTCSSTGV